MSTFATSKQKEIDVWIQDQTTAPFHRYFMTEDKTDITLTSSASKDDTILSVSAGHGFTATGEYMLINYGNYFQQVLVTSVSTNDITIKTPIGIDLPAISAVQIIRGSIEMNIDGSVTPVVFYCRPGNNSDPVDIQNLHVFMEDNIEGDDSKYGGISALTNGSFVRFTDGVNQNLGNYKCNADFIQYGGDSSYTSKAGGGNYSMDFHYNLKEKYGIVFRLDSDLNGVLQFTVNDDLTALLKHRIVAIGQLTLGE